MAILAVVIPYYKIDFFEETLQSLCSQTNKDFSVYIGDDNSKQDPSFLIKEYSGELNIKYFKFKENYGEENLVKQWMRCFSLIGNEEWFFFLPDDDVISKNYIRDFFTVLDHPKIEEINIIKYQTGKEFKDCDRKQMENNLELYNRILTGEDKCTLGDIVFRRSAFEKHGGFIEFPKGWASDHATLLSVSRYSLIYHISSSCLIFRMSGKNISSQTDDGAVKLSARIHFAKWIQQHIDIFPEEPSREFYLKFYWNGEYHFIYNWDWSFTATIYLFYLHIICVGYRDFFAPLRGVAKKMIHSIKNASIYY